MALTVIHVSGHLVTADNQGVTGQAEFMLLTELRDPATHYTAVGGLPVIVPIVGGNFAVDLWASDDVGVNPAGGTKYRLRIRPNGAPFYDKYFVLPHTAAGANFDISQIVA